MLNRQGKESKVDSPFKLQETDFSGFVLSLLRLKVLMKKSLHFLILNVLSSKMEPVEIMFIRKALINERGAEKKIRPSPIQLFKDSALLEIREWIEKAEMKFIALQCNCTGRNRPKGIICAASNCEERSLRRSKYRGAFILPLPTDWPGYTKFTSPLVTVSKFVFIALLPTALCSKYKAAYRSVYAVGNLVQIANSRTRWRCNFKRLSQAAWGTGRFF